MKFFHVYNERCYEGLIKNDLLNEDSGFKIQHAFSVPEELKFNKFAAKGTRLHSMIKENKIPFYVDRITGGITYHEYKFDHDLIREYESILGDWFLGFQLHESASNIAQSDIPRLKRIGDGPYDLEILKNELASEHAVMPDGTRLANLSHDTPEYYANVRLPKNSDEFLELVSAIYKRRMDETLGYVLPCDSYFLLHRMQNELGMKTFMPEVGWQIADMRIAVATTRGIAEPAGKKWGTYYETWIASPTEFDASMPCFNDDPSNEWYLTQDLHPDNFTEHGKAGGSSRLLQKRIYYYSLMSGADYLAEEWGLNCSYSDMNTFELSEYGIAKKEFIDFARNYKNVKAHIPFAIVLPKEYSCVEIHNPFRVRKINQFNDNYMLMPVDDKQKAFNGYVENVLKLMYESYGERYGNEGHVMTNSRFGDLFDIIYEDASEEVLAKYDTLIDASPDSRVSKMYGKKYRVYTSDNLEKLELDVKARSMEIMPVTVDGLHWLVSKNADGGRYLSIFNNEGNYRARPVGDSIDKNADRRVKVTFKDNANLKAIKLCSDDVKIERIDDKNYYVTVPAAGFAIFEF
ncbi:MAG: hypothetical protein E7600_01585 [Ruminococcaceae bacterium]|nr:hypothetical protein [Oscillospiraceae bacterium]